MRRGESTLASFVGRVLIASSAASLVVGNAYPQIAIESQTPGYDKNDVEKFNKLRRNAENGDRFSQNELGMYYYRGIFVKKNFNISTNWLKHSAENNCAVAQYNLAFMYQNGHGTAISYRLAAHWYGRAAEQGYGPAAYALAMLYFDGRGVAKNPSKSMRFLNIQRRWYKLKSTSSDPCLPRNSE